MKYLLLCAFSIVVYSSAFSQAYIQHYRDGVQAYEDKDYEIFLHHFEKADSLRPNHRVILYNLAVAQTLNNQSEKAFETLKYRTGFYAVDDFSDDENFSDLTKSGYIGKLQKIIEESNKPERKSLKAFEVSIEGFHAEGIAYNEQESRFYLTDIRNGWVYSVDVDGMNPEKVLDLKDLGYWSAMGIKFDPHNNDHLWITTSAMKNFVEFNDTLSGKSAVLKIDLLNKKVIKAYEIEGNHVFGDLIFSRDGSLIISDSGEPKLYILFQEEDKLKEFISHQEWWNLQGIALSENEEFLFVSDYVTGIYKVDLETKEVTPLTENNELLRGSDGIYSYNNKLVMLQNGTAPKRVASIILDKKGEEITFSDNSLEELDEPTLGVVVGSDLYYIANSPWAYYDQEGNPVLEEWKPILINRLSLK